MTAIKVPPLGESIVEATISRWLKNEGDAVAPGETLVELETDKITVDVPVMMSGVLRKRMRAEGDVVKVDEVLAEVEEGAVGAVGEEPTKPEELRPAAPPQEAPAVGGGGKGADSAGGAAPSSASAISTGDGRRSAGLPGCRKGGGGAWRRCVGD